MTHQLGARHIGHQAPFCFDNAEPRAWCYVSHVSAERELEATAQRNTVNRGDHGNGYLAP